MNTKRMRLVAGILSAIVLSAPLAMAYVPSLIFTNLGGQLHIVQGVPCGDVVNVTTSIAGGRMEVTPPSVGTRTGGGTEFHLTRVELSFTPFSVQHTCKGIRAAAEFREIGVQLAGAVKFTGEAVGAPEDQLYRFTIPKGEFLIFESVLSNEVAEPQTSYKKPSEDVTGLIDLRQGTTELHVVIASQVRLRAGCIRGRCRIDEVLASTRTADVRGTIRRTSR